MARNGFLVPPVGLFNISIAAGWASSRRHGFEGNMGVSLIPFANPSVSPGNGGSSWTLPFCQMAATPVVDPTAVDGQGLPLGVRLESASPHEVTLAEATLAEVRVPRPKGRPRQKPERLIADTAYDSDPLRQRLQKRGIELIAPYRENRKQRRYADGRTLGSQIRCSTCRHCFKVASETNCHR